MIFSFEFEFSGKEGDDVLHHTICTMLHSHREGIIYFFLRKPQIEWIISNVLLSNINRAMIDSMYLSSSESFSLFNEARYRASIYEDARMYIDENGIFQIGMKNDKFQSIISKPILVVENALTDGEVLEIIFRDSSIPSGKVNYCFQKLGGGGSQVDEVAAQQEKSGGIVLKIKDTDEKYPKKETINRYIVGNIYGFNLPCHEIENTMSEEVIEKIVYDDKIETQIKTIDMLKDIKMKEKKSEKPYFLYFDLKNGIKKSDLNSMVDKRQSSWILGKLSLHTDVSMDFEYVGFGEKICKRLIENHEAIKLYSRNMREPVWEAFLKDFFSDISWIVLSSRKKRT
ncbi:hypothetical protein [Gluconobacter cadivus]|uniref:Uncharacterized protein n=1 Tax=Gluconobacter cadivus TaxID=2728101 RepID=A0ABR9YWI1_9PROT|nr:hypothetical protein [Gluconobacter cadivus]MBF0888901.1 hypothetical protein [Gluconobacter cadivus]